MILIVPRDGVVLGLQATCGRLGRELHREKTRVVDLTYLAVALEGYGGGAVVRPASRSIPARSFPTTPALVAEPAGPERRALGVLGRNARRVRFEV